MSYYNDLANARKFVEKTVKVNGGKGISFVKLRFLLGNEFGFGEKWLKNYLEELSNNNMIHWDKNENIITFSDYL